MAGKLEKITSYFARYIIISVNKFNLLSFINMLKQIVNVIITFIIFSLSFVGGIYANELTDINHSKNRTAIQYLYDNDVISGYPDGTFKPDNTLNRAELLKILVGGKGVKPNIEEGYKNCFPDVKTEWFAPYVCYAKAQGWVGGYPDGTFQPAKTVNKAEAIKMLVNSQGYTVPNSVVGVVYDDIDNTAWYAPYIQIAKEKGLLEESGSLFNGSSGIKRSAISENIYRSIIVKKEHLNSFNDFSQQILKQKDTSDETNASKDTVFKKGFQKGVTFGGMKWSEDEKKHINTAINALDEFNVKWIAIVPDWFVFPGVNGTEIKPFYMSDGDFPNSTGWITPTLTDSELKNIIDKVRKKGIKVVLKPHIDPIDFGINSGSGRGSLNPSDWDEWFNSYEDFILHYAEFAERENADMLVIGTELDTAVRDAPNATKKWKDIIKKIRKIYSGPLTYSASCFGECWSPSQVGFWNDLDYIGFEPYFSLTNKNNPTIAEIKSVFDKKFDKFAYPLYKKYKKPIIITEANVYSYNGVNKHPIDPPPSNAKADHQEQADYYEAMFQSIIDKDWIQGIYWWGWYLGSIVKGDYSKDLYDPFVRKPAGQIMKQWYLKISSD